MQLLDLPDALLKRCFSFIYTSNTDHTPHLQSVRLVSQSCNKLAAQLSTRSVTLYPSKQSLQRLESISNQVTLSQNVEEVVLNFSFFHQSPNPSVAAFAKMNALRLGMFVEIAEHCREDPAHLKIGHKIASEWKQIKTNKTPLKTKHQKLLGAIYESYSQSVEDQNLFLTAQSSLDRAVKAILRFPSLKSIAVTDRVPEPDWDEVSGRWTSDEVLTKMYNSRLPWKGDMNLGSQVRPPVDILYNLLTRLGSSNVRPLQFKMEVTTPYDLQILNCPSEAAQGLTELLQNVTDISILFKHWHREGRNDISHVRTHDEMCALGSLTKAALDCPSVERLKFRLESYPVGDVVPDVTWQDLVKPDQLQRWQHLKRLGLGFIPMRLHDIKELVEHLGENITDLTLSYCYLDPKSDGQEVSWAEAVDLLRTGFGRLKSAIVQRPRGGEFGPYNYSNVYNQKEVEKFLLGVRNDNPLRTGEWAGKGDYDM